MTPPLRLVPPEPPRHRGTFFGLALLVAALGLAAGWVLGEVLR